ncbi:MAG TPA: oligopeptide:H+ symporter [Gemmatales bacterium]|nr:oligopeptide:H+ symporter [Gemmatales bacterium]
MSATPTETSKNPFSRLLAYFKGHPTGFYFFFWGELAERCSFYGMKVILIVYMTKTLGFKDGEATKWESYFTAAAFLTPLLGGWIADRYLGKYWTIVGFAIPYVIGNALMIFEGKYFLLAAMAIIAFGSGVIKPNISSLMGMTYDQQRPGQDQLRSNAFMMFYWAINFGSLISKFFMPILRNKVGPNIAFLLPTVLIATALAIFALGKRYYARDIPSRKKKLTLEENRERWTVFSRLLGVFVLIIVFWSTFLQKDNVWVYFIRDHIDLTINGVEYKPDQFLFLNAFFILTLLPLAGWIYHVLEKRGIKLRPTDKMQLGFVFAALAPLTFVVVTLLPGTGHSIFWVVLAFFFLTIGEVLISPVGLELAFVAAPPTMKGFVTACFLLTSFAGSTLNGLITPWYGETANGIRILTPTMYFGFQVLALLIAMTAFYFIAIPFNRRLAEEQKTAL